MFPTLKPGALLAALLLAVGGCADAPVQAMSDARQAIQAAEAAGAQTTAPAQMAQARDELKRAEDLLRMHQYRAARRDALSAHDSASRALAAATPSPR